MKNWKNLRIRSCLSEVIFIIKYQNTNFVERGIIIIQLKFINSCLIKTNPTIAKKIKIYFFCCQSHFLCQFFFLPIPIFPVKSQFSLSVGLTQFLFSLSKIYSETRTHRFRNYYDTFIGELWFHPTLWPTAINDEIARGVYARTGLAENVDQVVCLGGRSLIGTQTEKW